MTREEAIKILQPVISCSGDYMDYLDEEDVEAIRTLAVERPRGEWITIHYKTPDLYGRTWSLKCNQCNRYTTDYGANFCPNCGADMRKRGDDK